MQDTAGRVEVRADMVQKDILENLFRGVLAVVGDLLESFVGRSKDGVVGFGTVKSFDQVVVLVDQLCELGGVLALGRECVSDFRGYFGDWWYSCWEICQICAVNSR